MFSQSYGFSSSHVWMWELDHKEGWVLKNGCFWTVVLEKTLESPLDCKEIKPVNPKVNQLWIFIGRADAEAETPILWSPNEKNWLIRKDPDAGKDWMEEQKWMTEDEMVRWHYRLNGHGFEQALRDGRGQGSLVCCSPWGHKELDMIEWQNNNNNMYTILEVTTFKFFNLHGDFLFKYLKTLNRWKRILRYSFFPSIFFERFFANQKKEK